MMKILPVEDNERIARFVRKGLIEEGIPSTMPTMVGTAVSGQYDVMVLDRMFPGGIEGLAIVETLRKTENKTPILILSALAEVDVMPEDRADAVIQ